MKQLIKNCIVVIALLLSFSFFTKSYGQPKKLIAEPLSFKLVQQKNGEFEECAALLRDGLRDNISTYDYHSFFSDSKKYFSSDDFLYDYQHGKWQGDLSVVIEGIPIGLSAGSEDDKVKQWQKKVREASSLVITQKTLSTISKSTLNVEVAEIYNNCVQNTQKYGLSITVTGEKNLAVTIKYKTLAADDPRPKIASVELIGIDEMERDKLLNTTLKQGKILGDQFSFTATRKKGEEFLIALNTSNGLSIVRRIETDDDSNNGGAMPIGTVIASFLDFESFSKLTKSNPGGSTTWSPKSKWTPCDGRSVVGSKYNTMWAGAGGDIAPDLRGEFLRGLNQMDIREANTVSDKQKNPEGQKRGEPQDASFGPLTVTATINQGNVVFDGPPGMGYQSNNGQQRTVGKPTINVTTNAGNETRPNNRSVYYYMRIN